MRLKNPRQFWRQCQSVAASSVAIALVTLASYRLHFNNATVVLLHFWSSCWSRWPAAPLRH
jgi:hypothetical protein